MTVVQLKKWFNNLSLEDRFRLQRLLLKLYIIGGEK